MEIRYRHLVKEDNKSIAELIRSVFREFGIARPGTVYFDPTTDDLFALFSTPGSEYWVAEDNGKIIGGCGVYPTPGLPDGCAELQKLYLLASYRGKGTGRALMEKTFVLLELSDNELKEISGGTFPMLIIRLFGPNIEGLVSFWNGVKDGYERTTQP